MLRGIWGDEERYRDTYWSRFEKQGYYFAGDGAKYDDDGAIWLLGRVDDVMNVSGHRISTTESSRRWSATPPRCRGRGRRRVGRDDGPGHRAFVILRGNVAQDEAKGEEAIKRCASTSPRRSADRQAAPDHGRRRAAQDALGQDHAPAAA